MQPSVRARIRPGPPVAVGGRLLVPLVRMLTVSLAGGGMASSTPVALLIGEDGAWSFVPLEEGIGQEILTGLDLPPSTG